MSIAVIQSYFLLIFPIHVRCKEQQKVHRPPTRRMFDLRLCISNVKQYVSTLNINFKNISRYPFQMAYDVVLTLCLSCHFMRVYNRIESLRIFGDDICIKCTFNKKKTATHSVFFLLLHSVIGKYEWGFYHQRINCADPFLTYFISLRLSFCLRWVSMCHNIDWVNMYKTKEEKKTERKWFFF